LKTFLFRPTLAISPEQDADVGVDTEANRHLDRISSILSTGDGFNSSIGRLVAMIGESTSSLSPQPEAYIEEGQNYYTNANESPGIELLEITTTKQRQNIQKVTPEETSEGITSNEPQLEAIAVESEESEIQVQSVLPEGASSTCAICFCDFEDGDRIREVIMFHSST
jgi:hypothetical protein